jgi:GNAT superfamily N-acetyltransferase
MRLIIRPYEADVDGDAAFALWERSLGRQWPLERASFDAVVCEGFAALHDNRVVGLAALMRASNVASLQLLLVAPERRGQGIGSALTENVVGTLTEGGVREIRLGGTPGRYFWPGLPAGLASARPFLERRGWTFAETCWDLVGSLAGYVTPDDVAQRSSGATIRWATDHERTMLLDFECAHFPNWEAEFASDRQLQRSIVAVDAGGKIVGALLASDTRRPELWRRLLGDNSGSIGAVGVAESVRRGGVGTALVAYACEQLRDRGVGNCHIGWTVLLSFYGRLGFRPWRRFEMATRTL